MNNGEIKVKKNYFKVKFEDKIFFVERGIVKVQNDSDNHDDIIAVYFENNMCNTCTRGSYYGTNLRKIIADKLIKGEF